MPTVNNLLWERKAEDTKYNKNNRKEMILKGESVEKSVEKRPNWSWKENSWRISFKTSTSVSVNAFDLIDFWL